jgi:hypothetical protein
MNGNKKAIVFTYDDIKLLKGNSTGAFDIVKPQ